MRGGASYAKEVVVQTCQDEIGVDNSRKERSENKKRGLESVTVGEKFSSMRILITSFMDAPELLFNVGSRRDRLPG